MTFKKNPLKKNHWGLIFTSAFALFSMFFGSGNLVFPITVGKESGGHYLFASLGILFTGVVVPFLGVWAMMLYRGEIDEFFSCFGKKGIFLFSFFALALMGPFGVLARCLTVAHGALLLLFPQVSLPLSSFAMCALVYVLAINKNRIVSTLGTILTPFLLGAIALIAYFGLKGADLQEEGTISSWDALANGFFQGYQTMDLLAAFFFSQFMIKYLQQKLSEKGMQSESLLPLFYKSSFFGALILSAVYVALVLLGTVNAEFLTGVPPQAMLGAIAMSTLGSMAAPCVSVAVIFACLTTAIVLASLFADFVRSNIAKEKFPIRTHIS